MNEMQRYEELAARHNAAYAAFKSIYESKHPPPEPSATARDGVSLIIVLALTVVMVSSVIVSSSRTVEEFGGGWIGLMAFVMLEGGLVAYAFFRARRNARASKIEDARKLATFGLLLAFVSAVGANIDHVLKLHGITTPDAVNTLINLLVAVSAPTLAFISSDVLALELMAGEFRRRQARETFEASVRDWLDGLNRAWAGQQSRWGVRVDVRADTLDGQTPQLSAVRPADTPADGRGHGYGQGYNKRTDARTLVWTHFEQHPEDARLTVRELAEKIGVGKSTVSEVLREMRSDAAAVTVRETEENEAVYEHR